MAKGRDERHNENRRPKTPDFVPRQWEAEHSDVWDKGPGQYGGDVFCLNCGDEWSPINKDGHCPECAQAYNGEFG